MLHPFVRGGPEGRVVHEDSGAGVPAQDRIVVARRAEGLGLLIEGRRLPEAVVGRVTGAGAALLEMGPGAPLADDPHSMPAGTRPVDGAARPAPDGKHSARS